VVAIDVAVDDLVVSAARYRQLLGDKAGGPTQYEVGGATVHLTAITDQSREGPCAIRLRARSDQAATMDLATAHGASIGLT
jgi:hypothetical protein